MSISFMPADAKAAALITGACGGIGEACARSLGRRFSLVLTDVRQDRLDQLAHALRADGFEVAFCLSGDLAQPEFTERLLQESRTRCSLAVLVHAAGLSPALAGWRAILETNVSATEALLRAIETDLEDGFVAILIASMAGHLTPHHPEIATSMDAFPLDHLADRLEDAIESLACPPDEHQKARLAYAQSKRAVMRMCELRAGSWGARQSRIMSISPGVIDTPMGRAEAERNPNAAHTLRMTPLARWGSTLDIANAVDFIASPGAAFITGCDLRVDGGVTPVLENARRAASRA